MSYTLSHVEGEERLETYLFKIADIKEKDVK